MMVILLAMVGGLTIGSFLNVVVYRLPRGESLSVPGSHCPRCGNPVRAYDNVPVLSWLMLRGRCRQCHEPISARYPMVELTSATLAVAVVLVKHTWAERVLGLVLVAILIPVALIDFDERIIPNKITASGGAARDRPRTADEALRRARAADRRRRRWRVPAHLRARLPPGDGHGGRQARRGDGAVPRALGRRRGDRRDARGDALRRRRDGARRRSGRTQDRRPVRALPRPRRVSSRCCSGPRSSTGTSTRWDSRPAVEVFVRAASVSTSTCPTGRARRRGGHPRTVAQPPARRLTPA